VLSLMRHAAGLTIWRPVTTPPVHRARSCSSVRRTEISPDNGVQQCQQSDPTALLRSLLPSLRSPPISRSVRLTGDDNAVVSDVDDTASVSAKLETQRRLCQPQPTKADGGLYRPCRGETESSTAQAVPLFQHQTSTWRVPIHHVEQEMHVSAVGSAFRRLGSIGSPHLAQVP
jgi:hypothetical protein